MLSIFDMNNAREKNDSTDGYRTIRQTKPMGSTESTQLDTQPVKKQDAPSAILAPSIPFLTETPIRRALLIFLVLILDILILIKIAPLPPLSLFVDRRLNALSLKLIRALLFDCEWVIEIMDFLWVVHLGHIRRKTLAYLFFGGCAGVRRDEMLRWLFVPCGATLFACAYALNLFGVVVFHDEVYELAPVGLCAI
jgi:hypothetical protein